MSKRRKTRYAGPSKPPPIKPKKKYEKEKKIKKVLKVNFLRQRKNYADKLTDLLPDHTRRTLYINKKGDEKVRYAGQDKLRKKLRLSQKKFNALLKRADERKLTKGQKKRINKLHRGKKKFKKQSAIYSKETFNENLFFRKRNLPAKAGKNKQFYFRAGLWLRFKNGYTIQNFPVSHYDFRGYPDGYKTFQQKIMTEINKPHREQSRLVAFGFNYFDVQIIDMTK